MFGGHGSFWDSNEKAVHIQIHNVTYFAGSWSPLPLKSIAGYLWILNSATVLSGTYIPYSLNNFCSLYLYMCSPGHTALCPEVFSAILLSRKQRKIMLNPWPENEFLRVYSGKLSTGFQGKGGSYFTDIRISDMLENARQWVTLLGVRSRSHISYNSFLFREISQCCEIKRKCYGPIGKDSYASCKGSKSARATHAVVWRCHTALLVCVSQIARAPHPWLRNKTSLNIQRSYNWRWESLILPSLEEIFRRMLGNPNSFPSHHRQHQNAHWKVLLRMN